VTATDHERAAALDRALAQAPRSVETPALVIDLDRVAANIARLIEAIGLASWRPHVKTVKQTAIVELLLAAGVRRFKCATLAELDLVLACAPESAPESDIDVLLAYPVADGLVAPLVERARVRPHARIGVLADDPEHLATLSPAAGLLDVWLDVDVGMHRTGSSPARWSERGPATIAGLHGYEGHLTWDERAAAFAGYDALVELARATQAPAIHTSGSHGFAHALAHAGLRGGPWRHEVGCGTLVLSDVASEQPARAIGVEPAAFVATRVVSRPTADRITLDAGSKANSPDRPPPSARVLGHPELRADKPSEEHLPVVVTGGSPPERGTVLWLVPDHVCTTVNLYREAIYVRGDRFVGSGPVAAAGRPSPWYA
jgi:D-serine deaminase-like pyridoxal phosphate-dependent protein